MAEVKLMGKNDVDEFKNVLISLIENGKPNMGKNQVVQTIETAYATFLLIKGGLTNGN